MSLNLIQSGYSLLTYTRKESKRRIIELSESKSCDSIQEISRESDMIE